MRQHALAVIFITPMTIFLAEAANSLPPGPYALIAIRFADIAFASLIGVLGGWVLYHENVRYNAVQGLHRTGIALRKRKK